MPASESSSWRSGDPEIRVGIYTGGCGFTGVQVLPSGAWIGSCTGLNASISEPWRFIRRSGESRRGEKTGAGKQRADASGPERWRQCILQQV